MATTKDNYDAYIDRLYVQCLDLKKDSKYTADIHQQYHEHELIFTTLNDDCTLIDIYDALSNKGEDLFIDYLHSEVFLSSILSQKQKYTKENILLYVTRLNDLQTLEAVLINKYFSTILLSHTDSDGHNAFTLASMLGHTKLIAALVKHDALTTDVIQHTDTLGHNALMLAAKYGHKETVKIIISEIKELSLFKQCNHKGQNALQMAVERGELESVIEIIKHGPTSQLKDTLVDGQNILIWAIANKKLNLVKAILNHPGCDNELLSIKDEYGYTALMWARGHGDGEMVSTILAHPECNISVMTEKNEYGENAFLFGNNDSLLEAIESKSMSPEEGRRLMEIAIESDDDTLASITMHHREMSYEKLKKSIENHKSLSTSPKVQRAVMGKYRKQMDTQKDQQSIKSLKQESIFKATDDNSGETTIDHSPDTPKMD